MKIKIFCWGEMECFGQNNLECQEIYQHITGWKIQIHAEWFLKGVLNSNFPESMSSLIRQANIGLEAQYFLSVRFLVIKSERTTVSIYIVSFRLPPTHTHTKKKTFAHRMHIHVRRHTHIGEGRLLLLTNELMIRLFISLMMVQNICHSSKDRYIYVLDIIDSDSISLPHACKRGRTDIPEEGYSYFNGD